MSASNAPLNEAPRAIPNLVPVTVPGKLEDTVLQVSREVAQLHTIAQSGILVQKSLLGITTFSEAIGSLQKGYKLRVVAVLNEDNGEVTLIPPNGEVVQGQYEVVNRGVDVIRLSDGTTQEAAKYLELFKTKASTPVKGE